MPCVGCSEWCGLWVELLKASYDLCGTIGYVRGKKLLVLSW